MGRYRRDEIVQMVQERFGVLDAREAGVPDCALQRLSHALGLIGVFWQMSSVGRGMFQFSIWSLLLTDLKSPYTSERQRLGRAAVRNQ